MIVDAGGRDLRVSSPGRVIFPMTERSSAVTKLDIAFDESFHVDPHEHDDHAYSFFVLDGEVEFTVGDEAVRAGPGTWLSAPPGARHGFRNGGSGRTRVLNVHAPDAGFADWIRGL